MTESRRSGVIPLLAVAVTLVLGASLVAQSSGRTSFLGVKRAPANDEEFAQLVKTWTTRPEFLGPLVDHLPRASGVPTPKEILGYYIGAPQKLTYTADQQRYFQALERATRRVKTMVIGKTEEGRDIMVAFVSSEENIRNLESIRRNLKALADPRTLTEERARELIARTKPIYHITAGLHSTEVSPPEMVLELAYRLAVSSERYIQQIRDNVIVSFTPALEVDGRDRVVDWYYAHKTDEPSDGESFGGPPLWGKYVFHDNNRDINYGVDSLRHHLEWYLNWVPPIWHDLHQSQPFLYTFSGQPPNNENLDRILYSELPWFAAYEVNKLTSYGMPGVWHFGFVDTWSPGYLGFAASNHNGMLRMYEIYGSDGANTKRMRIRQPAEAPATGTSGTARTWFRPLPPYGDVDWSIRNAVNYSETAILSALELTSTFPQLILENFYKKSRNAVERGKTKPPYGYVVPEGQRDMTSVVRVVNLLRMQGIEVVRLKEELQLKTGAFPAGSFVVKLNQPYGPLAKTLLERQRYPDPGLRTYDDSAWTIGLMSNIDVQEIDDAAVLDAVGEALTSDVKWAGSVAAPNPDSSISAYAVPHNGSLNLITLRYRLGDLPVRGARDAFTVGGVEYSAGSFIIPVTAENQERVRREIDSLGLTGSPLGDQPDVRTVNLDLPRIAVYSTWAATEKVGWVRLAFDRFEIPYDLIYKDQVRVGNLRARYDVVVVPHQGPTGKALVYESPRASKPLPYRRSAQFRSLGAYGETDDVRGGMGLEGVAALQAFVEDGGLLMTFGMASYFPPEFGLTRRVDAQRPQGNFYAPGPIVRTEILEPLHPVFYGLGRKDLPVRWADGPLLQVPDASGGELVSGRGADREQSTVLLKFQGGESGVLSGLMRGADQIRNRPALVDTSVGSGRILLYAINPIYRWQNFGEHNLVFNALLYHNDLPSARPAHRP